MSIALKVIVQSVYVLLFDIIKKKQRYTCPASEALFKINIHQEQPTIENRIFESLECINIKQLKSYMTKGVETVVFFFINY